MFIVDVCAELIHIMGVSQQYRIINVHVKRTACVYFGSYIYTRLFNVNTLKMIWRRSKHVGILVDYMWKCTFLILVHFLVLSIKLFINARTRILWRMYRHLNEDRTCLLALKVVGKILVPQRNQNLRKTVINYVQAEKAAFLVTFLAKKWTVIEIRENTCNSVVIAYIHSAYVCTSDCAYLSLWTARI